jgi:DNA polymerase-3 subunit gamma/tau
MASQSLYRKWRSQTFSDLIGQEAVTRTLLNAVREERLAHAYLFCGPRGTGKTSTARLLAKAINCASPHDGEPCNECLSCREITAGRSPDVIEIDAASNTGVDNIRDLRETVNLLGAGGRYKVYIVDEVHMLSTQAFNALLKTLEEPPPHIIFVLATTEAHKVLPTVVSRCQRFDFRRFSVRDIVARLYHVAEGEGLELEPAAAELLARAAQGGMRDALSLLDQAMAFCGTHIALERTRAMLGLADPEALRRLIVHVAEQQTAEGLHLINTLVAGGADLRQLNTQLTEEWRALLVARAGANVAELLDRTDDDAREIATLAQRFSLEELTACARVMTKNETPARGLPVPQLALELAFLECVAIRRHGGVPATQPVPSAPSVNPPLRPAPMPATAPMPSTPPARTEPRPAPMTARPAMSAAPAPRKPEPEAVEELDLAAIEAGEAPPPPARPAVASASAPVPAAREPDFAGGGFAEEPLPPAPEALPAGDGAYQQWLQRARSEWGLVKQVCKQKSMSVAALLNSARPLVIEAGDPPVLVLQADHKFHLEKLREPKSRAAIEWALSQVLEVAIHIKVVPSADPGAGGSSGRPPGGPVGGSGPSSLSGAPGGSSGGGTRGGSNAPAARASTAPAYMAAPVPTNGMARPAGAALAAEIADEALPFNVTPIRPDVATAAAPPAPRRTRPLEEDVRADAVIQTLLKNGIELADVRPLDEDDDA